MSTMPIITVVGGMPKACKWLADVIKRTKVYLSRADCIEKWVAPLVCSALREGVHPCTEAELVQYKSEIDSASSKIFSNLNVCIGFYGISSREAYTQPSADGKQIFFQCSWAAVADNGWALTGDGISCSSTQYNRFVAVGVVKLLHELSHCMTPEILQFHYKLQELRSVPEPFRMMRIPTKLGYKYLQDGSRETASLGGLGFETERILTGVGSVQAHFTALWEIESVNLYKLSSDIVQGRENQTLQELELLDEEEWVNKVSGAADRNTLVISQTF